LEEASRNHQSASACASYEHVHGPSAAQPAQQNGNPTWRVARPTISISQLTQVNGLVVLSRRPINVLEFGRAGAIGPLGVRQPMALEHH